MDIRAIVEDYGLDELQQGIEVLFPKRAFELDDLLSQVLSGDVFGALAYLFEGSITDVLNQLFSLRDVFIWLLMMGIIASVMTHFVEIFDKNQVADLSFYFMYLLFIVVLLKCFGQAFDVAFQTIENIVMFVKLLVPVYLITVGISAGTVTAAVSYQLMLIVVCGVEYILSAGLLSLIHSYVMLCIVNGIWVEEKLTLFIRLVKRFIGWVLKGALGVVTGISIFQTLITPIVDSAGRSALKGFVSAIPGVGGAANSVTELVLGSAILIRNSVGVVLLMLLLLLCAFPLLKIALIAGMLKCAAAFMGVVSDRKLTACVDKVGEAGFLLFKTTGTAMLLFIISIAVTAALGRGIS